MENNLTFTVERLNPGTIGQDLTERRWGERRSVFMQSETAEPANKISLTFA